MGNPRQVLFSTAILVDMPDDEEAASVVFHRASVAIRDAAARAAADVVGAAATGVVTFNYPGQDDTNAFRCDRCGAWTSDLSRPDPIGGILLGEHQGERFLCIQCRDREAGLR